MNNFNDRGGFGQDEAGSAEKDSQDMREERGASDFGSDNRRDAPDSGRHYRDPAPGAQQGQPDGSPTGYYNQQQNPGYYNNTYPPAYPHQGSYPSHQPYNPYQYNANRGWQQQPVQNQVKPEKYEWKFEEYEKYDKRRDGKDGKDGKRKNNRGVVVFTVAILGLLSAAMIFSLVYGVYTGNNVAEEEKSVEILEGEEESAPDQQIQIASRPEDVVQATSPEGKLTIPQVAEKVLPSVIGVIRYDNNQYFETNGFGSGIVMSEDGYIITNSHVVAGGTGFKVQFVDGQAYDAMLVGNDPVTDLAVLKIDAEGLTAAQFGDSESLQVGETVIAVGNPAGDELAGSVTQGIVSAVNREVQTTNFKMTYIQTDAAINPGNSGGALANEYGQVIGINSSKLVAEGYEGIGFAIPISNAKPIIDNLIKDGKVTGRVMLGIQINRVVDEVDARNWGIQMGLMIEDVQSPDIAAGGVLKGDILTHIDNERVYDLSDVREILDTHKLGDRVDLTFYRRIGTKEQTFTITSTLVESE